MGGIGLDCSLGNWSLRSLPRIDHFVKQKTIYFLFFCFFAAETFLIQKCSGVSEDNNFRVLNDKGAWGTALSLRCSPN